MTDSALLTIQTDYKPIYWRAPREQELPRREILIGDVIDRLRQLPPCSIDCVVTSPPYYMLRDYGSSGQIGLEDSVHGWVERMRGVMSETARVIKPTGSVWLNLGDSFSRHVKYGAPAKGLLCAPERLLLALAADGWLVRNKVIWAKPNPMPNSVADRLSLTYEVLYLLTRSPKYYFDLDAIREPHRSSRTPTSSSRPQKYGGKKRASWAGPLAGANDGLIKARAEGRPGHLLGKNPGDVWVVPTGGYTGAHFATFPAELIRRPILASCPEAVCSACGTNWRRQAAIRRIGEAKTPPREEFVMRMPTGWQTLRELGELVGCDCGAVLRPGVVLDPFMGSGTTAIVAERLGRDWLGIDLQPEYVELATERIEAERAKREVINNKNNERGKAA
jgi:DNA modification methylase